MTGQIYAYLTATAVKFTGDGCDEYIERHGWVDTSDWYELRESRNDVDPLVNEPLDSEFLEEEVRAAFSELGFAADNGDGAFYAEDAREHDGWSYSYALHFKRKFYGPDGWTEEAWVPPESMC